MIRGNHNVGCYSPPPLKKESRPEIEVIAKRRMRFGYLPRWKKLGVVESHEFFMFPRGFIFRVIIRLNLV
jgi:hypothetical protein